MTVTYANIQFFLIYIDTARLLRGNVNVKFKLMTRCTGKYLNSPLYRGSIQWDKIPVYVQRACTMELFSKHVTQLYRQYVDLLG